jgi:mannose-1-phosphate guanylyltransferase
MCPRQLAPFVVIMAGGSGKRFWPVSRRSRPKQALSLFSPESLLEETLKRVRPLTGPGRVAVNTSRELRPLLEEVCAPVRWIEEPWGMDTAACVGLSAAWAETEEPGSIVALLPADHFIPEAEAFRAVLRSALEQAEGGDIVIVGIRPTRPEPGYGYIELGEMLGPSTFRVQAFREKPTAERAEDYLRGGRHLWNAGMFVARASVLLSAFRMHRPQLGAALDRMMEAGLSPEAVEAEYRSIEKISFDHAIMEKVAGVRVIRADFAWDDVGSWLSMPRIFEAGEAGNVVRGRHAGLETEGCIIVAEDDGALVATAGVRDLVIVQSGGAVLVAHKGSLDRLKDLVGLMEDRKLDSWL